MVYSLTPLISTERSVTAPFQLGQQLLKNLKMQTKGTFDKPQKVKNMNSSTNYNSILSIRYFSFDSFPTKLYLFLLSQVFPRALKVWSGVSC